MIYTFWRYYNPCDIRYDRKEINRKQQEKEADIQEHQLPKTLKQEECKTMFRNPIFSCSIINKIS